MNQKKYTSIITGDIVNSTKVDARIWLPELKNALAHFGKEPKQWQIFRGDMFQLEIEPKTAILGSMLIKAYIKQIQSLDVRMAIGIGKKEFDADKISQSNGSAFQSSGSYFEGMQNFPKLGLLPASKNKIILPEYKKILDFSLDINMFLSLASFNMDQWPPKTAEIVKLSLIYIMEGRKVIQTELAQELDISQSTVSEALRRSNLKQLLKMNRLYTSKWEDLEQTILKEKIEI